MRGAHPAGQVQQVVHGGSPRIVVIIPARNEAEAITATLASVRGQTRAADRIIVVANNCTDETGERAAVAGADVLEMTDNPHMKAGALNHALELVAPQYGDDDVVVVMDADTTLRPQLFELCLATLLADPRAGGVSSIFTGRRADNVLGVMQAMEFHRYKRDIARRGFRSFVLSGTASMFRLGALRDVQRARLDGRLPHGGGSYYDITGRTEDNEITLALLTLGYACPAADVDSVTDVMPTVGKLFRQRERWYNGALVNLRAYGLRLPPALRWVYWRQQVGLALSTTLLLGMAAFWALAPVYGSVAVTWWWLAPLAVLLVERLATVWSMGPRARVVAAAVIPEQLYGIFLTLTFAVACTNFALGRQGRWHAT